MKILIKKKSYGIKPKTKVKVYVKPKPKVSPKKAKYTA